MGFYCITLFFNHHLELRITTAAATQNSKCIIQNFLFLCFTVLSAVNNGNSKFGKTVPYYNTDCTFVGCVVLIYLKGDSAVFGGCNEPVANNFSIGWGYLVTFVYN